MGRITDIAEEWGGTFKKYLKRYVLEQIRTTWSLNIA